MGAALALEELEAQWVAGRTKAALLLARREANGVLDFAGGDFVVANQAGEDGEAGGVGGGPGVGTLLVIEQIPNCGGGGVPTAVGIGVAAVELVEPAIGVVEDEDVAVAAAGIWIALDGRVGGHGHGAGIAFVAVGGEVDGHEAAGDDDIGNANRAALISAGAEVGMKADAGADEVDVIGRIGIDLRGGDVGVPEIVGGKWEEAVEAGALAGADGAAGAGAAQVS